MGMRKTGLTFNEKSDVGSRQAGRIERPRQKGRGKALEKQGARLILKKEAFNIFQAGLPGQLL